MTADNRDLIKENRDYLIKQSEMLQAIIARMASNSLAVKQLGFTTWTALVGFGFTNKTPSLFVLALISLISMGFLDMYYLLLERRFRTSFNRLTELLCGFNDQALEQIKSVKGNFVKPESLSTDRALQMYLNTLNSWANLPYLLVILITLVILIASPPQ
jgi:hypothetical protein